MAGTADVEEKQEDSRLLPGFTARSQSPLRSAFGSSSEGEEVVFCWAVEVAVAFVGEEEVEMWVRPANPGFPSDFHNLPCCL